MKENMLRLGRLYILLILGVFFTIAGCSSDDDDEILLAEKTFLEKYEGTKWVVAEVYEGYIYYIRINNNQRIPFELWGRSADLKEAGKEEECYGHVDSYMDDDGGATPIEIVENSDGRFTIGGDGEYWCLEIRGETLKFGFWTVWGDSDSNIWDDPASIVFKKTTVDVDAFVICPDDFYGSGSSSC